MSLPDPAHSDITDQSQLTNGNVQPLRTLCQNLHQKIESFLQEDFQEERLRSVQSQCRHSLSIIQEALDKYPLTTLSFSYNGGKDCLVLLLLYLSLLSTHPHLPPELPAIHIPSPNPFPAVDRFVTASSRRYHLALTHQPPPAPAAPTSMKAAFAAYLSSPAGAPVQAIFVGTRRTDPHGAHLGAFDLTDRGWPAFMRVHPVLEWRYGDVWAFLRWMGEEWCELYDEGYTSLGGVGDTKRNPRLRVVDAEAEGGERWLPAWRLESDEAEREGRE